MSTVVVYDRASIVCHHPCVWWSMAGQVKYATTPLLFLLALLCLVVYDRARKRCHHSCVWLSMIEQGKDATTLGK